jgi:hypothetical protein
MKNNLFIEAFPHQLPTKHIDYSNKAQKKRREGGGGRENVLSKKLITIIFLK